MSSSLMSRRRDADGARAAGKSTVLAQAPAKPWVVKTIVDLGLGNFYRFRIAGENLYRDGEDFSWSVPDLEDERYDLSATRTTKAAS